MIGKLAVADTNGQRLAYLGLGLSILAMDIERPGVGVERQYVVAPPNLQARDPERLGGLVRVLGVIENQFPVGVVGALDPGSGLTFEISVCRASLGRAPGPVESLRQLVQAPKRREASVPLPQRLCGGGVLAASSLHPSHAFECAVIAGKSRERLIDQLLRDFDPSCRHLEVSHLGQEPCGCLHFARRRLLVGLIQEIQCPIDVAVKLAKRRAFDKTRHVAGPKVQHPLRRFLRFVVIAQSDGRLSDISVREKVVRRFPVKGSGLLERLSILLPAEQDRHLNVLGLEVAGREMEALVDGLLRLRVVIGVRCLPHLAH